MYPSPPGAVGKLCRSPGELGFRYTKGSLRRQHFLPPGAPMRILARALLSDEPSGIKSRIVSIYGVLFAFNIAGWLWALTAFHRYPAVLGTAFLAYCLGLRHAVDADHIAAIDNVTRKLMQAGKRPIGVGLMFSLGHSTIVVLGSLGIAATALTIQHSTCLIHHIGFVIGTAV